MIDPRLSVAVAANSFWNIVNFRAGLVRALRAADYEPFVIAPVDLSEDSGLRDLDVGWDILRLDRSGLNPFTDLKLLLSYRRILKRRRPLVFLGFTIKPNIYGCIAARSLRIPAIANISGLGTVFVKTGPLTRLVRQMYRFALSRAEVVFFQNPDDRALFVDQRIVLAGRAQLLPGSGIDLDQFEVRSLPEGAPVFLLIARLLGDKGVREFVETARRLRSEGRDARFQLLGPLDEGNRTAIRRGELDGWIGEGVIEYLGTADDVRPFIAEASAVVLPSYREGLPRTLLEGAAMARPLIATDVPGCREVVTEGVEGFLCKPRDAGSLAAAMARLLDMPEEQRLAMGRAARRKVEERFSEKLVIDAYLEALAALRRARR